MTREKTAELRRLMEEYFLSYLRGKKYKKAFQHMLEILEMADCGDDMEEHEIIYLFFHLVLLDGFDRIERLEKKIDAIAKERM